MVIKRDVKKELRFIIYSVIVLIGVYLAPYAEEDIMEKIGLECVLGIPILLIIIRFFRRLKLIPNMCELTNNELIISYFNKTSINIPLDQIKDVILKIHSAKTAIISINLYEHSTSISKLDIYKNSWGNFVEFCKQLSLNYKGTVNVLTMKDNAGKECYVYSESVEWYEFLTKRKTIKDTLREVMNEGIIKKALLVFGFIVVVFFQSINDIGDISTYIWFAGIMLIFYLIISFYLRMKGYSRKESIENFIGGIFYVMLGLSAVYGIIYWIIKFLMFLF